MINFIFPENWKVWLNTAVVRPKDADGMANSVDPDQSAPDLGRACFLDLSVLILRIFMVNGI